MQLSEIVRLSAPAVHERIKRLRASGAVKQRTVMVEPVAVAKPFLAFVLVAFDDRFNSKVLREIAVCADGEDVRLVAVDRRMQAK